MAHFELNLNDRVRVFTGDLKGRKGLFKGMATNQNARVLFDGETIESVVARRTLEKLVEISLDDYKSLLSDLDEWRYQMRDMRLRWRTIAPQYDSGDEEEINNNV